MAQPRDYPFDTHVVDLAPEDLEALTRVHEGWYVEYKEQPIGRNDIAKSLSAFANQFGGWFFLGIAEDRDDHTAGKFSGIPTSTVEAELETIRNATKDLLRPSVFYEHKVIDGPVSAVGLPADRSVVVIHIPQGPDTPYVHNNGRVYRRIADSSDPIHITDRAELDVLSQRREASLQRLADRVQRSPKLSVEEENRPYLQLHMLSDPYEILGHRYRGDLQSFADIMKGSGLPFDNVFNSHEGFVARQIIDNDANLRLLTWEFSRHCHTWVTLPINVHDVLSLPDESVDAATIEEFALAVINSGIDPVRILDLTKLLRFVGAASIRHRRLAGEAGVRGPFYVKCRLENLWRTIPYVDTPNFINHINRFGLPLIQDTSITIPLGSTLDSFIVLDEHDPPKGEDGTTQNTSVAAFDIGDIAARILPVFGLSLDLALFDGNRLTPRPTP